MATGTSNGQPVLYIYRLEYLPRREICRILDLDGKWEELAGAHMNFSYQDVKQIAKSPSPTDNLLERWGQKNHTVKELFLLLSVMQHYQAMEVLKPYVDRKYHQLIHSGECNITELLKKEFLDTSSRNQGAMGSGKGGSQADCKPAIDPCNLNTSFQDRTIRSKTVLFNGEPTPMDSNITVDGSQINVCQPADTRQNGTSGETAAPVQKTDMLKDVVASFAALNVFHIDLSELEVATRNWDPSCLLGKGGFGTVFRGTWKNTQVAIKRMELRGLNGADLIPLKQSTGELRILNSYRHDNILPLYGYSFKQGSNPCLVYQYMPNGSLEDRLLRRQGTPPLTWKQRLNIARGTARGLQFLHTTGEKPLIHGDIKSANILLDVNFEPKIGDFGLAREGPQTELTHMEVSRVHGTKPYLPSEYLRNRKISVKVDTYSYGIVLYEICTGMRAYDPTRMPQYLKEFVEDTEDLLSLRDSHAPSDAQEIFHQLMLIGQDCAKNSARDRPEMVKVYERLDLISLPVPDPSGPMLPAVLPSSTLPEGGQASSTYSAESQIPDISMLLASDQQSAGMTESALVPDLSRLGLNSSASASLSTDSASSGGTSQIRNTRNKSLFIFE